MQNDHVAVMMRTGYSSKLVDKRHMEQAKKKAVLWKFYSESYYFEQEMVTLLMVFFS